MDKIKLLSVEELKKLRDKNPHLTLVDVRELFEWRDMHIPGAYHIPKDKLTEEVEKLVKDKEQPIYIHCHSGMRSIYAAQSLMEMGYKTVYSIEGGIVEWRLHGYPIEH